MSYLTLLELDGPAFGAFVPELNVSVVGKTPEQVRERVQQGIALALHELEQEGAVAPAPQFQAFDDLPADLREDFQGVVCEFFDAAPINPQSLEIERAIAASGLSDSEIARRMASSPAGVARLKDYFYWGHSFATLRKLGEALGEPVGGSMKKAQLQERLSRLRESVVPPEDRQRAGILNCHGRPEVQLRAIAADGSAVNFRNRVCDLHSESFESPVITVRGTNDQGRPAALTAHVDSLQFEAIYLGFAPA